MKISDSTNFAVEKQTFVEFGSDSKNYDCV